MNTVTPQTSRVTTGVKQPGAAVSDGAVVDAVETRPLALISGGGSGGHVFPGLAIAEELQRRGWLVNWAGSRHGIEARLVGAQKIPFHHLPARPLVGQGWVGKVRSAATLARAAWSARSLVRRSSARVVVGTGGYVSAPAVVGARLAARPAFLLEPNADAGFANRCLSRLAAEAAVAFDETRSQLACPSHTTGIPVRGDFFAADAALPTAPPLRLLILGGSQGARQINELMPRALAILGDRLGLIEVCHQTGNPHLESTREAYRAAGLRILPGSAASKVASDVHGELATDSQVQIRCEVVPFLDDMVTAMARSHLIVSRAGAITLAEICATGRPSLLVPLALAGGHQKANAERLAAAGAAHVLPPEAEAEDLAEILADLMQEPATLPVLSEMAHAARGLGHRHAAASIADRLERLTHAGRRVRSAGESEPQHEEAS